MKSSKFTIGDWVKVSATVTFGYNTDNQREVVREQLSQPWVGQIVGARNKPLGRYVKGGGSSHDYFGEWDYDPPYLQIEGSVLVWLVARGVTNIPLMVLEADLEVANIVFVNGKPEKPLPWIHSVQPPMDDRCRQYYRDAVKDAPRDERGRFVKGGIAQPV